MSKLADDENLLINNTNYRLAMKALLFILTVSRPDISAAVSILSHRNRFSKLIHLKGFQKI